MLRDAFAGRAMSSTTSSALSAMPSACAATKTLPSLSPATPLRRTSSRCCKIFETIPQSGRHRQAPLAQRGARCSTPSSRLPCATPQRHRRAGSAVRLLSVHPKLHRRHGQTLHRRGAAQPGLAALRQPAAGDVPHSLHPDIVKPNIDNLARCALTRSTPTSSLALKRQIQERAWRGRTTTPGQPQRRPVVLSDERRARRGPRGWPCGRFRCRKGAPAGRNRLR